jgi:membrane-bound metal-dependent hydrolase YbcI (DUF457 family)
MFIGHNAVGFASKAAAPRASLGVLMAAPMLPDLLWPIFLLLGIEHVRIEPGATRFTPLDFYDYPWSHSLLTVLVQGVLFGGLVRLITRDARGGVVAAFGVVSHWVCDFVMHRPDLPLWPFGPRVGLGVWNYPSVTVAVEGAMFVAAAVLYREVTKARDRAGTIGFWSLFLLLWMLYFVMIASPPPQTVQQIATMDLAGWLIPLWAAWFDRHRTFTA